MSDENGYDPDAHDDADAAAPPPVPVLFPTEKLRRFRRLQDESYPLATYPANDEAQLIIADGLEEAASADPGWRALRSFAVCRRALAKFPFSVDAFLEVAYLYAAHWSDVDKARLAYERAIECSHALWPDLEDAQARAGAELHEARLLQQAHFGLASLELDAGRMDVALEHVAALRRLDPGDASGHHAAFMDKYAELAEPPKHDSAETNTVDDSEEESFFGEGASNGSGEEDSEEWDSGEDSSEEQTESENHHGDEAKDFNTSVPSRTMKREERDVSDHSSASNGSKPKTAAVGPPHPSSLLPPKPNRYLTRHVSGNADRTLATSFLMSASVALGDGDVDAALEHARSILRVDPRDEGGCLWRFFERFARTNFEEDDLEQILSGGPASAECYFRYCFIILDVMKLESGDATLDKVNETLVKALCTNPLVPELLLSDGDIPECSTQQVAGGISEAIWYVKTDQETWNGVGEALQYLKDARFQKGPKPSDNGQILRTLLSVCHVIIDVELPGTQMIQTYECTMQGSNATSTESTSDDSLISCLGIPVVLDHEGRRPEGRIISFSYDNVQSVHFWHLLHDSKFLIDKRAASCEAQSNDRKNEPEKDDSRMKVAMGSNRDAPAPIEKKSSSIRDAAQEFMAANRALGRRAVFDALEHTRNLLDIDADDDRGFILKIFSNFIRCNFDREVIHIILPVSRENAETFFRWRFVVMDKKKRDDGKLSAEDLNEAIVRALDKNCFVPMLFINGTIDTKRKSGPFVPGSMEEAMWYVNTDLETWKSMPDAVTMLDSFRFRGGLKPPDDGALLMNLLERGKALIDIIVEDEVVSYECSHNENGKLSLAGMNGGPDASSFVCYAIPAKLGDKNEPGGHWITFDYNHVDSISFWKILLESKFLIGRKKAAGAAGDPLYITTPNGSLSDLSSASSTPKESMLRRTLNHSTLSNSSLVSDKSDSVRLDGSESLKVPSACSRKDTLLEKYQSAQTALEAGNIDEAMGHVRQILLLDPNDDAFFAAKLFQLFVEHYFEPDEADELLSQGRNCAECFFRYSFLVLDLMKRATSGRFNSDVEETLVHALQTNPFVPGLLLDRPVKPTPKLPPVPGELSEAIFYVDTDAGTWSCVEGALTWLGRIRFRKGPKPRDDGTILRNLMRHGKVVVDIKLAGEETVTYQCTSSPDGSSKLPILKADASKIVCFATPAALGLRGLPRKGKYIAFSYRSVQRVHYWHVLHNSQLFAERRMNSSQSVLSDFDDGVDDTVSSDVEGDIFAVSGTPSLLEQPRRKTFWLMDVFKSHAVRAVAARQEMSPRLSPKETAVGPSRVSKLRDKLFSNSSHRKLPV